MRLCIGCNTPFRPKRSSQQYCTRTCSNKHKQRKEPPAPSPATIRARCLTIQATWDANTRLERTTPCYRPVPFTFPLYKAA